MYRGFFFGLILLFHVKKRDLPALANSTSLNPHPLQRFPCLSVQPSLPEQISALIKVLKSFFFSIRRKSSFSGQIG